MHKELNVIEGGCAGMQCVQDDFDLEAPMKWLNKDDAATAQSGSEPEWDHVEGKSQSGAAKLVLSRSQGNALQADPKHPKLDSPARQCLI